jgi:hypothetical protein
MLGRFLSPDPAGIAGGINLYAYAYAYAGNNPLNVIDPLGLKGSGGGGGGSDWACMKCSRTGKGWGPKGKGGRGGGRGSGGGGGDDDGLEGDVSATADAVDAYQNVMFGGVFDQGALEDVALMGAFLSAGGGPDLPNAPAAGFVTSGPSILTGLPGGGIPVSRNTGLVIAAGMVPIYMGMYALTFAQTFSFLGPGGVAAGTLAGMVFGAYQAMAVAQQDGLVGPDSPSP